MALGDRLCCSLGCVALGSSFHPSDLLSQVIVRGSEVTRCGKQRSGCIVTTTSCHLLCLEAFGSFPDEFLSS